MAQSKSTHCARIEYDERRQKGRARREQQQRLTHRHDGSDEEGREGALRATDTRRVLCFRVCSSHLTAARAISDVTFRSSRSATTAK